MHTLHFLRAAALTSAFLCAANAFGQDAPKKVAIEKTSAPGKATVTGKFLGNGKPATLKFVSAHEREPFSDKPAISLIFTEKDQSSSKKPAFDAGFGEFGNAVILSVHHDGKIFGCEVVHSGVKKSPFSSLGDIKMSDFKMDGGNISGSVSTNGPAEMRDETWEVDFKFTVPAPSKAPSAAPAAPKPGAIEKTSAPAGKADVTGKFLGNGKPATLAFVSAHEHEPFSDKPAISLVFTKNHSASKKPAFDASFGKFGSSLVLSIHEDGGIFGCQVGHTGLKKGSFSTVGILKMSDFKIADGTASGSLSTGGPDDFFGDKWDVDIKFTAPLPPKAFAATTAEPKPATKAPKDEPEDAPPAAPAGPKIAVKDLPLPKSAAEVEYKQLVEQIAFSSPQSVEAVTKEFSAGLKKQGWKDGAGGLATKKSAILKRENGAAKLTVMIGSAPSGSTVKIFTEGLDWTGADKGDATNTPPKPTAKPAAKDPDDINIDDIEADVKKAVKDALKKLPK